MKLEALVLVLIFAAVVTAEGRFTWKQGKRTPHNEIIPFSLALKQRNVHKLETTLLEVSDPNSPSYGQHWSQKDILDLVSPPKRVSKQVAKFLRKHGVEKIQNLGDVIKAEAAAFVVESLFETKLYQFEHPSGRANIHRAVGSHKVPHQIKNIVEFVAGLYEFPQVRIPKTRSTAKSLGYVIPQLIQQAYGVPNNFQVSSNSSLCLAEFQDDKSYSKTDLALFSKEMAIPNLNVSHRVGPFSSKDPDAESTLDVEYGAAVALNNSVWFWTVKGWMYEFATALFAASPAPYIVSMSWGWPEPNQCDIDACNGSETSAQYVDRVNTEFMKIGLRGITLLAASGDQGAPGDDNPYCTSKKKPLSTIFPGASPWVLSVGATMLVNSSSDDVAPAFTLPPICQKYRCANTTAEGVCTYPTALITTGGGFSNYVPRPSWQEKAVSAYLSSGVPLPASQYFNQTNRGFPDVSALGHNYLIALSEDWTGVDGTSCSSPVFGGIIALLNDWRLNNNKTTLGYINPVLYQAWATDSNTFKDIITGNNKCTESCCADTGYEATKGWDPVTGLGTPNFPALLKYVMSLP